MGNVDTARAFLDALEAREPSRLEGLLAEDVTEVLPLDASGGPEPAAVFEGRAAVLEVQNVLCSAFSVVEFREPVVTGSADGAVVFVESRGRRVQHDTGRVYENIYLLKFEFVDGLVTRITEYSNPVAFAKFFDRPVG